MTSSFQARIRLLLGEVEYLFLSLNELEEKYGGTIVLSKQAIIKLSLAYSFGKMFFIGQNLKHVHITYSFLELLIFFWLALVDI